MPFAIAAIIWASDRGGRGGEVSELSSSETLAGYTFFDLAVKAKQEEEDNVTSE